MLTISGLRLRSAWAWHSRRLNKSGSKTGLSTNFPDFAEISRSLPVYIVGSGASLMNFDFSSPHFTSGFKVLVNDAMFLDVESNLTLFELSPNETWNKFRGVKFGEIIRSSHCEIAVTLPRKVQLVENIPKELLESPTRTHLFAAATVRSRESLGGQLQTYLSDSVSQSEVGLDPGFSVGRILLRLLKLGFRDFRLIGVDLFSPEHFWQVMPEYSWVADRRPKNYGLTRHNIASIERRFPAQDFFEQLQLEERSFGFSVRADPGSGLSKIIQSWDF